MCVVMGIYLYCYVMSAGLALSRVLSPVLYSSYRYGYIDKMISILRIWNRCRCVVMPFPAPPCGVSAWRDVVMIIR